MPSAPLPPTPSLGWAWHSLRPPDLDTWISPCAISRRLLYATVDESFFNVRQGDVTPEVKTICGRGSAPWETFSHKTFVDLVGNTKFQRYLWDTEQRDLASHSWKSTYLEPGCLYKYTGSSDVRLLVAHHGPVGLFMKCDIVAIGSTELYSPPGTLASLSWQPVLDCTEWTGVPHCVVSAGELILLNKGRDYVDGFPTVFSRHCYTKPDPRFPHMEGFSNHWPWHNLRRTSILMPC